MIINNFDINGISAAPTKTDSPLVIHANAVLFGAITFQRFQSVSRRDDHIAGIRGSVQGKKLSSRNALDISRDAARGFSIKNFLGLRAREALKR